MTNPSVESVFVRSWQLLSSNWIIVLPGLAVAIIIAVLNAYFNPPIEVVNPVIAPPSPFVRFGLPLVLLALTIAQYTYTTGMAGVAWIHSKTSLAAGTRAFERDAGNMLVAMVGLFLVGIVASFLALRTIGLSMVAYMFFFIYTFSAAVVGERPGLAAMLDSCRIALARPVPTLIMVVIIAVVVLCFGFLTSLLSAFIGPLVSLLIVQALGAYVTLVVVGEYLALRGAAPRRN